MKNVLFVETDKKILQIVSEFMALHNIKIIAARSIMEALRKLDKQKFHCLLLDAGFRSDEIDFLLQNLKSKGHLNEKTQVIITVFKQDVEIDESHIPKIADVLVKPYNLFEILGAIAG